MIDLRQFHRYIVRPVLAKLEGGSLAAERLICGSCLQESRLTFIDQLEFGGDRKPGPAFGLVQMEKETHDDIWENFLKWRLELATEIRALCIGAPSAEQMTGNLYYAVAMMRMAYYRHDFEMPAAEDYKALAAVWKKYYNTSSGAGLESQAQSWFKLACAQVN